MLYSLVRAVIVPSLIPPRVTGPERRRKNAKDDAACGSGGGDSSFGQQGFRCPAPRGHHGGDGPHDHRPGQEGLSASLRTLGRFRPGRDHPGGPDLRLRRAGPAAGDTSSSGRGVSHALRGPGSRRDDGRCRLLRRRLARSRKGAHRDVAPGPESRQLPTVPDQHGAGVQHARARNRGRARAGPHRPPGRRALLQQRRLAPVRQQDHEADGVRRRPVGSSHGLAVWFSHRSSPQSRRLLNRGVIRKTNIPRYSTGGCLYIMMLAVSCVLLLVVEYLARLQRLRILFSIATHHLDGPGVVILV